MRTPTQAVTGRRLLAIGPGLPAPRVVVVTGGHGAAHDRAARELGHVLTEAGCVVELRAFTSLLPRSRLHRVAARSDLAVATHPFAAQALGQARATKRLETPVVAYVAEASVHPLWVHQALDLHLVVHDVAAATVAGHGGVPVVVRPAGRAWHPGATAAVADPLSRHEIVGPRALITGGASGRDLEQTCRDVLATGLMTPVALCGDETAVAARLRRVGGVVALGRRDDVRALMASSDCVVHHGGGPTSLDALASGSPVVTYRPRGRRQVASARDLEAAGLVPWARDLLDLTLLLAAARHAPRMDRLPAGAPDPVAVLAGSRPVPARE